MEASTQLREWALDVGFDLCGVTPLRPPREADRFEAWLAQGHHAGLEYLARDAARIVDPRLSWPEGRTLLVVGLAHSRAAMELPGGGRVARYAAGRDYHNVVIKKLRRLRARLSHEGWIHSTARAAVDAAPLLERSHAAEAGLGFLSKAANLLHPRFGPWFFLGELILERELAPTVELPIGSCGTCTACLDACPTGAILSPGQVDAGACISYATIEHRGAIPHTMRESIGEWFFGCDVCSEVCPWGHKAPDLAERFGTHRAVAEQPLERWIELRDPAEWKTRLEGSPLQRARREGLARNAAIVLGNAPRDGAEPVLLEALSFDPSAIVRESAAWALARSYGQRAAVEAAHAREPDSGVRELMRRTLDAEQ